MAQVAPRTSGLAIAAFVLGIMGCVPPVPLILGIVALSQIKSSRGRLKGETFAILGICSPVIWGVVATVVGLTVRNAGLRSKQSTQESLLKELNNACMLYRNDVGDYPEALADLTVAEGAGPFPTA